MGGEPQLGEDDETGNPHQLPGEMDMAMGMRPHDEAEMDPSLVGSFASMGIEDQRLAWQVGGDSV